jgi:hypothetical protein
MKDLIATLFQARDVAHELHLKTRSFAAHLALGDLYDGILAQADALAETYQGKYGLLDLTSAVVQPFNRQDAVTFVRELATFAEGAKASFNPADTHLLNDWDTLISMVYKAKYKLENLV